MLFYFAGGDFDFTEALKVFAPFILIGIVILSVLGLIVYKVLHKTKNKD